MVRRLGHRDQGRDHGALSARQSVGNHLAEPDRNVRQVVPC